MLHVAWKKDITGLWLGLRLPFKSFKRFKALQGCGPTVRLTMEGGGRAFKV